MRTGYKYKKKMPFFYKALITALAVGFSVVAVLIFLLNGYLRDYEASLPDKVADKVFEDYFISENYSAIYDKMTNAKSEFETKESVVKYLNESEFLRGEELEYISVASDVGSDYLKYSVRADDPSYIGNSAAPKINIASFLLKKSSKKSANGFALYELSEITLNTFPSMTVSVLVPIGYSAEINGKPMSDKYISGEPIETDSCNHMPEGVEGVKYNVYTFENLAKTPIFSAKSNSGISCEVNYDAERETYVTALAYNDGLKEAFSEHVIEAAHRYAAFMQRDTTFAKVAEYLEKGTQLYDDIRKTPTNWVIDHDSYEFADTVASEFYSYDENTFSCRVKFTHILKRKRLEDYKDYVDVTFYLRKNDNGEYLIYDRTNN